MEAADRREDRGPTRSGSGELDGRFGRLGPAVGEDRAAQVARGDLPQHFGQLFRSYTSERLDHLGLTRPGPVRQSLNQLRMIVSQRRHPVLRQEVQIRAAVSIVKEMARAAHKLNAQAALGQQVLPGGVIRIHNHYSSKNAATTVAAALKILAVNTVSPIGLEPVSRQGGQNRGIIFEHQVGVNVTDTEAVDFSAKLADQGRHDQ